MIDYFIKEETERKVLEQYRNREIEDVTPTHHTFPGVEQGRSNAAKRVKAREGLMYLVKLICGSERRKIWKQLKKDYYEFQQHLKVA